MTELCTSCETLTDLVCQGCSVQSYCTIECQQADWLQHREVCATLIGLPTFDSLTKGHPALKPPRTGEAVGIAAFARLGRALALRITQEILHDAPLFRPVPVRQMMTQLHNTYYEAATYWAEWFGEPSLTHIQTKNFARLLEDTMDIHMSLSVHVLYKLLVKKPWLPEKSRPQKPELFEREKLEAKRKFRAAEKTSIAPTVFMVVLRNIGPNAVPDNVVRETRIAWQQNIIDNLQITIFSLRSKFAENEEINLPFMKSLVDVLIESFSLFGADMVTASGELVDS